QTAELRLLSKGDEVLARHELDVAARADRLAVGLQLHARDARRGKELAPARRQFVARVLEGGRREQVAELPAWRGGPGLCQLAGLRDWQLPQHDRVDEREHRRGAADPEAERQDGDGGEPWSPA